MKTYLGLFIACLLCGVARGEVRVFVEEQSGKAWLRYQCTAGELVRAFALDVTVDKGVILGISDFFSGVCGLQAKGYGIFPAAFRDFATVHSRTNATWDPDKYTPLAAPADGNALPGLNSSGVTLEFAGLWDAGDPRTIPDADGVLCALQLSETAMVTLAANQSRGGVVSANRDQVLSVRFTGAIVHFDAPRVTGITLNTDTVTITFEGGELEMASHLQGPWMPTGNTSGQYSETIGSNQARFYRVRRP